MQSSSCDLSSGHIGLIEESLDRLEGKATEADKGKKM